MTTVINLKGRPSKSLEPGEVYIGRALNMGGWRMKASPWANPFKAKGEVTLDEVLDKYEAHLRANGLMTEEHVRPLLGQKLCCWCAPDPCHGDIVRTLCWRLEQIDAGSSIELDAPIRRAENLETVPPLGLVACDKLPGRTSKQSWPEGPRAPSGEVSLLYHRFNCSSSGAGWLKSLSPFYVGPFVVSDYDELGEPRQYHVTCLENLWQATKVEARFRGKDRPKRFWFTRRDQVWADGKAHRHVVAKADRCPSEDAIHYWQGRYISYEQARKELYIRYYVAALTQSAMPPGLISVQCRMPSAEAYARLESMVDRGHNLLILGPDGRQVVDLEAELADISKPFGHELVLTAMLSDERFLYEIIRAPIFEPEPKLSLDELSLE